MYAFSLMLFLILLYMCRLDAAITALETQLPLVFILGKDGEFRHPNQIKNSRSNKNHRFTGKTQFLKDDSNNQMFFCPAESDTQKEKIDEYNKLMENNAQGMYNLYGDEKASENCLFRKTFKKKDVLKCTYDAIPSIHPVKKKKSGTEEVELCGPDRQSMLFKFVYEVCNINSKGITGRIKSFIGSLHHSDESKFAEKLPFVYRQETVYEICYNLRDKKTIYTRHTPSSGKLLINDELHLEGLEMFTMMTDANQRYFDTDEFSKLIPFYDRLSNPPTEQNQLPNNEESDTVKTNEIYLSEKLVSPDDLAPALLKKTTFHYINVKPMHQGLVGLWNHIGKLVRDNFKDSDTKNVVEIYTGAYTFPPRKNLPADVPEVWIKFIRHTQSHGYSSLVIIMKNEYKPKDKSFQSDDVLDDLCLVDHCKSFKRSMQTRKFSYLVEKIRCCPPNEKIGAFFNTNLRYDSALLTITNLTDDEDVDQ